MATFDPTRQTLSLRIVFDGLGMAGKTTNLRQIHEFLSASRRGDLYIPEERRGRTLYFDWLEVEAGRLDDLHVRCQLLTVPGQFSYVQRRWHLLGSPDAIVVVVDSTPQGLQRARYALRFLQEAIAHHDPPVPLIVQANKQDIEGALPAEGVARVLELPEKTRVVEASAIQGAGVRPTLVFALQAARERAQRWIRERGLEALPVGTETAEQVYHQLLQQEAEDAENKVGELIADRVILQLQGASPLSPDPSPAPREPPRKPTPPSEAPPTLPSSLAPPTPRPAHNHAELASMPSHGPLPDTPPLLFWPAAARVDLQDAQQNEWKLHTSSQPHGEDLIEERAAGWARLWRPGQAFAEQRQGALALRELAEARVAAADLLPSPWNLLLWPRAGVLRLVVLRRALEPALGGEQGGDWLDALVVYTARVLTLAARHGVVLPLDPARVARGPQGLVSLAIPEPITRWGEVVVLPLVRWLAGAEAKTTGAEQHFLERVGAHLNDPEVVVRLDWVRLYLQTKQGLS